MVDENTKKSRETSVSSASGATLSVVIHKLKIVDCADDDEDMNISLGIRVRNASSEIPLFYKEYKDVYVEEETKIGNDSKCVFFPGERVETQANVNEVVIRVAMETLDGDGFNWNGHHDHVKKVAGLSLGENRFTEGKQHSHNPVCQGVYELNYSIILT